MGFAAATLFKGGAGFDNARPAADRKDTIPTTVEFRRTNAPAMDHTMAKKRIHRHSALCVSRQRRLTGIDLSAMTCSEASVDEHYPPRKGRCLENQANVA